MAVQLRQKIPPGRLTDRHGAGEAVYPDDRWRRAVLDRRRSREARHLSETLVTPGTMV